MKARLTLVALVVLATSAGVARADVANVASQAGIAEIHRTFSINPTDFNRDGRDDFFFVRHIGDQGPENVPFSTLYRGIGGAFVNHATRAFGKTDKHGCAWRDANRDGRPDMFCAIGFTQFSKNELWIQKADGSFTNRAQALGLTVGSHGRYRYATFIHANNDSRPDIYVARYTGSCFCDNNDDGVVDYAGDDFPNELWINEGGSFRHAPGFGLDLPIGSKKDNATCAQAVDYDRDGDQDLLVCGWKKLHLFKNKGGTGFADVTSQKGISGNAVDARLVDLDGDKARDLVRLSPSRVTVRYGNGSGGFGPADGIASITAGEGLAFGRFNSGTTTDVYVLASRRAGTGDQPDKILFNKGNRTFSARRIPAARGAGDDVAALDYNQDRRADFVVTNGDRKFAGPVQLFTWRPAIRIVKIYYDSPGTDTGSNSSLNAEWIRIKNTGSKRRTLTGWKIRDASGHVYRFGRFRLRPGRTLTVHTGRGSNTARHRYWGRERYVWNNRRDTATLKNRRGSIVERCSYRSRSRDYKIC